MNEMPVQPSGPPNKRATAIRRPLLIVCSLSDSALTSSKKGPGRPRGVDIPSADDASGLDENEMVFFRTVEDLQQLILHVKALVKDHRSIVKLVDEWLNKLLEASADLQRWLLEKKLYSEGQSWDKPEQIEGLEYFCNEEMVSVEDLFIDSEHETQKDLLLTRLLEYWIMEVRSRAFAVYHLFILAGDISAAKATMSGLDAMQYPPSI